METSKTNVEKAEKGFIAILHDLFRSVRLSIFLLILLAILSIIGTIIKQNADSAEYLQHYGPNLYEVLRFFDLFDMYHSWWFSAILALLVINLVLCSLDRLPGVWRQVFRQSATTDLKDSMLKTLSNVEKIPYQNVAGGNPEAIAQSQLIRYFGRPKRVENEGVTTFFSEKGRFSRLGVYITHLSILVILMGGLIGSRFGFKGFAAIFEGETTNRVVVRMDDGEVPKSLPFSIRCDDFNITYYDLKDREKQVKEYSSRLTVLEGGKEVLTRTIRVNHPLHYKGLSFYQSSYGMRREAVLGVVNKRSKEKELLKVQEGMTVPTPNGMAFIQLIKYAPQIHNMGEGVQLAIFRPNREPQGIWVFKGAPKTDQGVDDLSFTLEGVTSKEYTGLQVARDPGVWVVWIGSALMILGLIVSFFFSHQRVWVRLPKKPGGDVVVAGAANKNRIGFESAFAQLVQGMRSKG